jgi:hypothetical protein
MNDDEKAGFWKGYDYAVSIFYPQIAELKAQLADRDADFRFLFAECLCGAISDLTDRKS